MKITLTRAALAAATAALAMSPAGAADSHTILAGFTCAADERYFDRTSGSEDNYAGATDDATPRANFADSQAVADYLSNHTLTATKEYDQPGVNNYFLDTIRHLRPNGKNATKAHMLVKFRSNGGQFDTDQLLFGDLSRHGDTSTGGTSLMQQDDYAAAKADNMGASGWNLTSGIHHADLSTIMTRDGSRSLLDVINAGTGQIDVMGQDDIEFDFVKVVVCVAP